MAKLIIVITCLLTSVSLACAEADFPSYMGEKLGDSVTITSNVSGKTGTSTLYSGDSKDTGFQAEVIKYDGKTYFVRGALYDMWKNWGKQDKRFGLPVNEQYNYGSSEDWRQDFEGGYLVYRHASNVVMVYPNGYTSPTGGYGLGKTPPKVEQAFEAYLATHRGLTYDESDTIRYHNKGIRGNLDYYSLNVVDSHYGPTQLIYSPVEHLVYLLDPKVLSPWADEWAAYLGLPISETSLGRDLQGNLLGTTKTYFQYGEINYDLALKQADYTLQDF